MNFDISSDSDDGDEVPFAERVANKAFGRAAAGSARRKAAEPAGPSPKRRKAPVASHAFSDSSSEPELPSPARDPARRGSVVLTPPPAYIVSDTEDLPDTEELVARRQNSASSGPSRNASAKSDHLGAKGKNSSNKENKEAQKQRNQEERRRRKEEKEAERQGSRQEKELERMVSRQTSKEDVAKYLTVVLDPAAVSSGPGPAILAALRQPPNGKVECVFEYAVEAQAVPGVVAWRRRVVARGPAGLQEATELEGRCLLLLPAEELATRVLAGELGAWARQCRALLGGRHLTLVVYDYQAYFRAGHNAEERVRKAMVRGQAPSGRDRALAAGGQRASLYSVEEALVQLALDRVADHFTVSPEPGGGWQQCAALVFHHTRAVAEAPLKLKKGLSDTGGFNFWAKADSKDCVAPKALPEYWKAVLMQVSSGAGLEKASAIAALHPSPARLAAAYAACPSEAAAAGLLAGLEVRRTDSVLGGSRNVQCSVWAERPRPRRRRRGAGLLSRFGLSLTPGLEPLQANA